MVYFFIVIYVFLPTGPRWYLSDVVCLKQYLFNKLEKFIPGAQLEPGDVSSLKVNLFESMSTCDL